MITVEELKKNPALVDAALELVKSFFDFNGNGSMTRCVGHLMNDFIFALTTMKDVEASAFNESGCYVDFMFDAAVKIDEAYMDKLEKESKV